MKTFHSFRSRKCTAPKDEDEKAAESAGKASRKILPAGNHVPTEERSEFLRGPEKWRENMVLNRYDSAKAADQTAGSLPVISKSSWKRLSEKAHHPPIKPEPAIEYPVPLLVIATIPDRIAHQHPEDHCTKHACIAAEFGTADTSPQRRCPEDPGAHGKRSRKRRPENFRISP